MIIDQIVSVGSKHKQYFKTYQARSPQEKYTTLFLIVSGRMERESMQT